MLTKAQIETRKLKLVELVLTMAPENKARTDRLEQIAICDMALKYLQAQPLPPENEMIKLGNVIVRSNWDSGTHLSFSCGVENPNSPYTLRSLDSVISFVDIKVIEQMIAQKVYAFTRSEEINAERKSSWTERIDAIEPGEESEDYEADCREAIRLCRELAAELAAAIDAARRK